MYQNELSREAKLIVEGRQLIVRDVAAFWNRLLTRLGVRSADGSTRS